MSELLYNFSKKVERYTAFIFGLDEPSGDVEGLLSRGKIEQLVREGRTPFTKGYMTTEGKRQPYYQVPPKGFHPDDISEIYFFNGMCVFVDKLGVQRKGSGYILNNEQSQEVERRIDEEFIRMNKQRVDLIHFK
jgi:hypothetical protein